MPTEVTDSMTADSGRTIVTDRRGLVLGARIASGAVAAGVAAVVVAVVVLVPLPTAGPAPRTLTIQPAPADQVRVCPGAAVRFGDETGGSAGEAFVIGEPVTDGAAHEAELLSSPLNSADAGAPPAAAPEELRVGPAHGALVAGAQSQEVEAPGFRGFAAAVCGEPSGSTWLVGGATTVGRSTSLLLANPTDVPSRVSLAIFGENGKVVAPGLTGIVVPAHGQRVLSLAGFAPGVVSPVVHVTARGGRVVAELQQSIVRGLDAVGVELIGGGTEPEPSLVIPGVRILDAVGTSRSSALADWHDVVPVVRLAVPGDAPGLVTVRVVPDEEAAAGTSFELAVEAGTVVDIPLDAGGHDHVEGEDEEHAHGLEDGLYTVFVDADVPVVAGVRASTAVDSGGEPAPDSALRGPPSDFAWFSAAPPLDGAALVVVPPGPSPLVSIVNPTDEDVELELTSLAGADPVLVAVPAGATAAVAVAPGAYLLNGADGLAVGVSFAGPAASASFVVSPPRPAAAPLVVHPD